MNPSQNFFTILKEAKGKTLNLTVKIIPKSKENQIIGFMPNGVLKIKISATPEKGKANQELIKFLSETFKIPQKNIEIIQGLRTPSKKVKINF